MSGLQRVVRHPDRVNDPHARARLLASQELVEPLEAADAAWLEEHLAGCEPCRTTADGFARDATLLRRLRVEMPIAPRDLGARVSLALDDEVRRELRRRGGRARGEVGRPVRWPRLAFAGVTAAAIVALLVLPLAVPLGAPPASPSPGASLVPLATPLTVATQPVAWVRRQADGTYVIARADVRQVCPGADGSACGTLDAGAQTLAALDVKPSSVLLPRDGNPAVVVGEGAVYAIALSPEVPVTTPAPGSSSLPTNEPAQTPTASGEPASPPVGSPTPSRSPDATATAAPETEPPATSSPAAEPTPPATGEPTPEPTPEPATPEPATPLPSMPPATPVPTAAASLAIADGVVLVGAAPVYSPDAQWLAFSARPLDGSQGPDLYVWRVGEPQARVLTGDHSTVFSGWLNGAIVASAARVAGSDPASEVAPAADADPATVVARSYLVDPATGSRIAIPIDGAWRPLIDPTERVVVFWSGALAWSPADVAWLPAAGRLVAASWLAVRGPVASPFPAEEPGATPVPGPTEEPIPTPSPTPSPAPTAGGDATPGSDATPGDEATPTPSPLPGTQPLPLPDEIAAAGIADWEVRFDPAGRRLGVWVADPAQPGAGRLSLVTIADDGQLGGVLVDGTAALPGFSIGADRLAWATPPGQNGQGSLVVVFAWNGDATGQLQSLPEPGDEPVVVAR
jgi:hypothetical protein